MFSVCIYESISKAGILHATKLLGADIVMSLQQSLDFGRSHGGAFQRDS